MSKAIENIVKELADGQKWSWMRTLREEDAAKRMLGLMARERLIEERTHPHGGLVWRVNGRLYGRTDGIGMKRFDKLKEGG